MLLSKRCSAVRHQAHASLRCCSRRLAVQGQSFAPRVAVGLLLILVNVAIGRIDSFVVYASAYSSAASTRYTHSAYFSRGP
jgi:hypothetical protein